jgi:hypothetical protein
LLKVKKRHGAVFELGSNDAGRAESKAIPIERYRPLEIIYAQRNNRDSSFHDELSMEA